MGIPSPRLLAAGIAAGTLMLGATTGFAQDNAATRQQIQLLKQQMQQMQQQIENLQMAETRAEEKANAAAQAARQAQAAAPPRNAPRVTETASHRFGLSSADGANSIALTGRLNVDTADYLNYNPMPGMKDKHLASGINLRRARIGVTGTFMNDWNYALIYDFGGNSDSLNNNNAFANGNAGSPFSGNTALSGVENALITYNGFYDHGQKFPVAIDFGVMDVPWTLQEATSSNDILFMERSSAQVVAAAYGGGDSRTAFGARSNNDRYFAAAYFTGPNSGALHTDGATCVGAAAPCVALPSGHGPQTSFLARGSYQVFQNEDFSLHLGADFADLFRPRGASNAETITLADRPELRVDPSQLISSGAIPSTRGMVFGGEAAAQWHNAFIEGEYFHYSVDQVLGKPTLEFNGGYVEASYTFGGRRRYSPASGGYTGVIPDHSLSMGEGGGWGALELAARYSVVDLNDLTTIGGKQTAYSVGLNYYPNLNMKFMLDFEHGDIYIPTVIGGPNTKGATLNAIAARTQIMF